MTIRELRRIGVLAAELSAATAVAELSTFWSWSQENGPMDQRVTDDMPVLQELADQVTKLLQKINLCDVECR